MVDLLDGLTLIGEYDTDGPSCSSWAPTVHDIANANDDDDDSISYRNSTVKGGTCTYSTIWRADLGADELVGSARMVTNYPDQWYLEHADDAGGPWTTVHDWEPGATPAVEVVDFDDPIEARHWRVRQAFTRTGVGFVQEAQLREWSLGDAEPPPDPEPPDPSVPDWTPPEPSRAIVEVFVNDPDGARWDVAEWDEATWPAALWVPIDYASTRVAVTDGTDRGELGILADPRASRFDVDTYDPDRDLDPNNSSSPFTGQLVAGLPIRLRHRSTVLRTARVRTVEWSFVLKGGRITASDLISDLANATLPPTTDLADTLFERASDAIAAVGLGIRVLPPGPTGDPALVDYTPAARRTAWQAIAEAARSVLWVPYVSRDNELGFRPWSDGLERGRAIASDELIDLVSWQHADGLYSAVRALDSVTDTVEERAATPTPAYGRRVHDDREDTPTLDAAGWAAAVLADRRDHRLRFRPGSIRPLDADSVETLGTIEVLEGIDVEHLDAVPAVEFHARVLGRLVEVVDETIDPDVVRSRWRFAYSTSASPSALLVASQDPSEYLLDSMTETDHLHAS